MTYINIEIKARCPDPDKIRKILEEENADFKGTDHQIDTYFNTNSGILKLRKGNIENCLIYYDREDQKGPKQSKVTLYQIQPDLELEDILTKALGVLVVVDKQREIYFINNVKFHIDKVQNLGNFIEIEAQDIDSTIDRVGLLEQCEHYMKLLGIQEQDLIQGSYSDLLLKQQNPSFRAVSTQ